MMLQIASRIAADISPSLRTTGRALTERSKFGECLLETEKAVTVNMIELVE